MAIPSQPYWIASFARQLHRLRGAELERILPMLELHGRQARVLEIGGGDGWQARELARVFTSVESIDVSDSIYRRLCTYPVTEYDGHRIPMPDSSIDLVFSSNVLEHIPHVEKFQQEIQRVLAPGGRALHVLPSSSWRFWMFIAHYPALLREIVRRLVWRPAGGRRVQAADSERHGDSGGTRERHALHTRVLRALKAVFWEERHGARGNLLSELWLFSRRAWVRLFERTGWTVESCQSLRLMYTGRALLGEKWGIESRTRWSRLLGSSTHVTVLRLEQ